METATKVDFTAYAILHPDLLDSFEIARLEKQHPWWTTSTDLILIDDVQPGESLFEPPGPRFVELKEVRLNLMCRRQRITLPARNLRS